MKHDEAHIIQEILNGKTNRYEYFLDKYGQQVFALVARIVSCQEDAEELTQDVFLKAFQQLSSFKAESSFSTWIYRIAYNAAISATRKQNHDVLHLDDAVFANLSDAQVDEALEDESEEQLKQLSRAMEKLKLPTTNITAVTMPCFGTSDDTLRNALELMDALGVTSRTVSIKDAVLQHFKDIGHDPKDYSVTYENAQARERTQVLMDIANKVGGIVLGTGDLSEMALGWCTYNGDHMSMYSVNADVPKTLVRWIVTSIAEENIFPGASEVLLRVVDTPISPELLPPDAVGKIAQKTEDLVGPYALHDFFLYWAVRYQYRPAKIYALARIAFDGIFDGATIKKWLTVFFRRFFNQQFKRNCVPDGVKVGTVGLSPRGDWQMPSDASSALWLAEIDAIEL